MNDPAGVYVIKCKVNGKVYVGSSLRPRARMQDHRIVLAKGKHRNPHLQSAWNKYGPEVFMYRVKVRCLPEVRHQIEQEWIIKLRATDPKYGFNIAHPVRQPEPSPPMSEVSRKSWLNEKTRENRRSGITEKW